MENGNEPRPGFFPHVPQILFNRHALACRYRNQGIYNRPGPRAAGASNMHTTRRARLFALSVLGLAMASLNAGCQTWIGGMTLPSGHYLEHHPPQYFPEEPDFPLQRELSYQEEAAGLLNPRDRAGVRNPAPVPPGAQGAPLGK